MSKPILVEEALKADFAKVEKEEVVVLKGLNPSPSEFYNGRFAKTKIGKKAPEHLRGEGTAVARGKYYLAIHGCAECIWIETKICPYSKFNGRDVSEDKFHSNKICNYKKEFVESMRDELNDGKPNAVVKEGLFKQMIDDSWLANHRTKKALKAEASNDDLTEVYWRQALDWKKFTADLKLRWLKQDEGSKVTVEKGLNPVDFAKMVEGDVIEEDRDGVERGKVVEDDK